MFQSNNLFWTHTIAVSTLSECCVFGFCCTVLILTFIASTPSLWCVLADFGSLRCNVGQYSMKNIVLEIISNIASMENDVVEVLVHRGVVPLMIRVIRDQCATSQEPGTLRVAVLESAVWTLGNLAGGDLLTRNLVIASGALDVFLNVLYPRYPLSRSLTRITLWAIYNFPRGGPFPDEVRRLLISTPLERPHFPVSTLSPLPTDLF